MHVGLPGDRSTEPDRRAGAHLRPASEARRRPGRRRAPRLVRGRWPRAAQDVRRRAARLGLVPDGALRRPGPRRRVHVRGRDVRASRRRCRRTRSTGPSSTAAGRPSTTATIAIDLGPDWPFAGCVVQRFELTADSLTCRMELHADEPMPASIGWHPWFLRRIRPASTGELELDVEPGAMYVRDAAGIATGRAGPTRRPGRGTTASPTCAGRPSCAGRVPRADHRIRLPGLGDLHLARGRPVRRAADGAARRAQHGPDDRPARTAADRRDDLALAVARAGSGRSAGQSGRGDRRDEGQRPGQLRVGQLARPGPRSACRPAPGSSGATSLARSTTTSGVIPSCQIWRPLGVSHSTVPDPQRRPVRERELAEDRAGAERLDPDDLGPAGVLDRARHDLGRAGRAAVDEHDERQVGGDAARRRPDGVVSLPSAARSMKTVAALEELAGDRVGLVDVAARVAAQVEDQAVGAGRLGVGQGALRGRRRRRSRTGRGG